MRLHWTNNVFLENLQRCKRHHIDIVIIKCLNLCESSNMHGRMFCNPALRKAHTEQCGQKQALLQKIGHGENFKNNNHEGIQGQSPN